MTEQTPAAAPTTLDRDVLAKELWTLRKQAGDWETGSDLMRDYWLAYADAIITHVAENSFPLDITRLAINLFVVNNDHEDWIFGSDQRKAHWFEFAKLVIGHVGDLSGVSRTAMVSLFTKSGRFHASEAWRVPAGATSPKDMEQSPDFHRFAGGAVVVDAAATSEFPNARNWGVPYLLLAD